MPAAAEGDSRPASGWARGVEFWGRATAIYMSYKITQARASFAEHLERKSKEAIKEELWSPQHEWAGEQMWDLCASLRGFYLKVHGAVPGN